MNDLNVLFLPVGNYCRREVVTCAPSDRLSESAALMRSRNISSLVVVDDKGLAGIITDRDLRNKVVAECADPSGMVVGDVMNSALVTIDEEEFLFEAMYRLSRHGIHRLVVTDSNGGLAGIITDSDILRIKSRSPQQLVREIDEAPDFEELKKLHQQVQGLVEHLTGTGVRIRDLVRLIAHLNDRILLQLISILRVVKFPSLPEGFAFVVLGSEGREEQTLTTDQDNALILADDLSPEEFENLKLFSHELIDGLIAIGVPSCPGGIMAKNEDWRRSISMWRDELDQWFATPTPENLLKVSMFSDLRFLSGEPDFEKSVKEHVSGRLAGNEAFLGLMTANLLRFRVPIGWFGRLKTEKDGKPGQIDLKKAGIFAITEGIKILALASGIQVNGTRDRIERMAEEGKLEKTIAVNLAAAFDSLVYFRLRTQVDAIRQGRQPDNRITLDSLNRMEQNQLRSALEVVRSFQGLLQRQFGMRHTL